MNQRLKQWMLALCAIMVIGLLTVSPETASAAPTTPGATPANQLCTDFAALNQPPVPDINGKLPTGILTNLTDYIKGIVNTASHDLFQAFTGSSAYTAAVGAAATLMVVVYAVGFTIGVVQASFGQILIRLIKLGILYTLISPTGWSFFSDYVVNFFNNGTDQLIALVMNIGSGGAIPADKPFLGLDHIANVILSPDMIIAILGSAFASGPYGFTMAALMSWAVWGLIKMLIDALKSYAIAFVVRALLLGVAPIFFVFLLFDRTKQLFSGWVNTMVVLSLRPILYFTFISFFLVMLTSSAHNMLGGAELCWSEFANEQGSQNKTAFWRFVPKGQSFPDPDKYDFKGTLSCRLNGGTDCPNFPINIVDLLSFLILIYVAGKFGSVVESIANEISNSYVNLDVGVRRVPETVSAEAPKSGGVNQQASNAARKPIAGRQKTTNR